MHNTQSRQGVFIPASDYIVCMMRFPSEKSENLFSNPNMDFDFFLNNSKAVFSVYILLYLTILDGVVHPLGFRFINLPINFHVAFMLFLHEAKRLQNKFTFFFTSCLYLIKFIEKF